MRYSNNRDHTGRTIDHAFVVRRCSLLFVSLSLLLLPVATSGQGITTRIMPLGDSITAGTGAPGGYRGPLYQMLTSLGYLVDFVGNENSNTDPFTYPFDPDHEGHAGWTIRQIDANVEHWLDAIADPDVILLHIGTNDFGPLNDDVQYAATRFESLLEKIAGLRPYAHIVATNLLERCCETENTRIVTLFNPYVTGVVARQVSLGRRVTYLDMRSAVPISDMFDGLHPTEAGYQKMAAAWASAITAVVSPGGEVGADVDGDPPGILQAEGGDDRTSAVVTFSKPMSETVSNLASYAIGGGLQVLSVTLAEDKRTVTLETTSQTLGAVYTITVSNVVDRIGLALPPSGRSVSFFTATPPGNENFELTTPWGSKPSAWAVCEPGGASQYTWTRNGNVIAGADSNWYLLREVDNDQMLRCGFGGDMSTAVRIGDAPSPTSPSPQVAVSAPAPVPTPTLASPSSSPTGKPFPAGNPAFSPSSSPTAFRSLTLTTVVQPTPPKPGSWIRIFFNDFESPNRWGNFIDPLEDDADAKRYGGQKFAHSGLGAIKLRDNSGTASSVHTADINVSSFQKLRVGFWFYARSFDNSNEDFLLEYSTDSDSDDQPAYWAVVNSWARGVDFDNDIWYEVVQDFDPGAINSLRIRFRCDASGNGDVVYLDDVSFSGQVK